jgi:hypothetical protein
MIFLGFPDPRLWLRFSRAVGRPGLARFPVAMARGKHLFPFRTEQLSPSAPMVLGLKGPGRVGRRRSFRRRFGDPDGVLGGAMCRAQSHPYVLVRTTDPEPKPAGNGHDQGL